MKEIKPKRISLQKNIRIGVVALFCIIFLFTISITYGTYQEPTTSTETVVTYTYTQTGIFDFTINLKNNSIYNKTEIKPEREIVFKQIVDSINASFTYHYRGNESAETTGQYSLSAQVTTDLWEKNYAIIPKSNFNSNKITASFDFDFPINITFYENVVTEIDDEIGIGSSNPILTIECNIVVSSQTSKGVVYDSFIHSVNLSLGGNIIEFGGDFVQSDAGVLTGEEQVFLQDVVDNRNIWSATSLIFFLILVCFYLVTKNTIEKADKTQKMVKKIKKKYGEWIVEVEKPPKRALGAEVISVKSLEDLIKTSEELGKPVLYHTSSSGKKAKHAFYVIDELLQYEHALE